MEEYSCASRAVKVQKEKGSPSPAYMTSFTISRHSFLKWLIGRSVTT